MDKYNVFNAGKREEFFVANSRKCIKLKHSAKSIIQLSFNTHTHTHTHINPLKPELNPIFSLLALLADHFLHVNRIRVKSLTLRLLMLYIYI